MKLLRRTALATLLLASLPALAQMVRSSRLEPNW